MIIGSESGPIYIYLNKGTLNSPEFSYSGEISNISVSRCQLQILDFDNDNKKDLVCGNINGTVEFYQNIGSNLEPQFTDKGIPMTLNNSIIQIPLINGKQNTFPEICDWDNDGDLDMILGSPNNTLMLYLSDNQTKINHENNWSEMYNPICKINSSYLIVKLPNNNKIKNISVSNLKGQEIKEYSYNNVFRNSKKIKIKTLSKGLLFIKITDYKNRVFINKFF